MRNFFKQELRIFKVGLTHGTLNGQSPNDMESPEVEFPLLFLEARIILKPEMNSVHVYKQPLNIFNLLPKRTKSNALEKKK